MKTKLLPTPSDYFKNALFFAILHFFFHISWKGRLQLGGGVILIGCCRQDVRLKADRFTGRSDTLNIFYKQHLKNLYSWDFQNSSSCCSGLLLRNPKIFFKNVTINDWIMGRKEKFLTFKDEIAVNNFIMESLYQNQRKTHIKTRLADLIIKVGQFCCLTFWKFN